ncbi:MAG: aspartate aminotransferase family protein [Oscillospiraceae bacterium]|nr:aspartate aminotransferase family protein [Oscillospiraceae bacterium]
MEYTELKRLYDQYVMPTSARAEVAFIRGEGCTLYDQSGKPYIDLASGIGVNSVGHAHPKWVKAVSEQAALLAHVSNLYHTVPGALLAKRLAELSGLKNVFFANSGAEANEGAIKLARKYSYDKYGGGRNVIITLTDSFHGRTVTTLSATGQDKFHTHFFPFTEGFKHVPANDIKALESALDACESAAKSIGSLALKPERPRSDVCAVMIEVVQGEGGILPLDIEYIKAVRRMCDERDVLLICDEVQTGIGRCGTWFAYQRAGILPDIVSFAKGIAGGLPLGGIIANEKCADVLAPGTHATTYSANLICCEAALAVLDIIGETLPDVGTKGRLAKDAFAGAKGVKEVRGEGLMIGIATDGIDAAGVVAEALRQGVVCLTAGQGVVRLLPPLVISREQLLEGAGIIKRIIEAGRSGTQ